MKCLEDNFRSQVELARNEITDQFVPTVGADGDGPPLDDGIRADGDRRLLALECPNHILDLHDSTVVKSFKDIF